MSSDPRLSLIRDTLSYLREESIILASPEEALYFRSITSKNRGILNSKDPTPPNAAQNKGSFLQKTIEPANTSKVSINEHQTNNLSLQPQKTAKPEPIDIKQPENPVSKQQVLTQGVETVKEPSKTHFRSDTPLEPTEPLNISYFKNFLPKHFPHITILDTPPDDANAKKQAMRWKTKNSIAPISILSFLEPPEQKTFLTQITKAIDVCFGNAKIVQAEVIEKEKQWQTFINSEDLKIIIACDYTLWQLADLMKHYKENPSQQTRSLGKIPLLLLPDLSLYLKDPLLKRSLWKAICSKISS